MPGMYEQCAFQLRLMITDGSLVTFAGSSDMVPKYSSIYTGY
jgi:hypothetical protein